MTDGVKDTISARGNCVSDGGLFINGGSVERLLTTVNYQLWSLPAALIIKNADCPETSLDNSSFIIPNSSKVVNYRKLSIMKFACGLMIKNADSESSFDNLEFIILL